MGNNADFRVPQRMSNGRKTPAKGSYQTATTPNANKFKGATSGALPYNCVFVCVYV